MSAPSKNCEKIPVKFYCTNLCQPLGTSHGCREKRYKTEFALSTLLVSVP